MHERSLVQSLLNQVEALCRQHGGASVDEVRLELGPLCGVEPLLVGAAFDELARERGLLGARLVIDDVGLTARCPNCGEVQVEPQRIVCPVCGARDVQLVRGDEVRLESITIRQEAGEEGLE